MVTTTPELPSANSLASITNIMVGRIILSLLLVAASLFCLFGLMATLEPMQPGIQWTWRGIYGLILIGNIAGLIHIIRGLFSR